MQHTFACKPIHLSNGMHASPQVAKWLQFKSEGVSNSWQARNTIAFPFKGICSLSSH